jgi:hypothetical protein
VGELERLLSNVQTLLEASAKVPPGDAIDMALGRPARTTAVVSLKDAPEVEAFRNELIDGLIRVDTVNQLLRLVNEAMTRLVV